MAHSQQQQFMESVRDRFPHKFSGVRVLDVGSLDINHLRLHEGRAFNAYKYYPASAGLAAGASLDVVFTTNV